MTDQSHSREAAERVQRKKRLLQQRDEILESLGRDVFENLELPVAFQGIPAEREEIQAITQQLEERIAPLAYDLERMVAHQADLERDLRDLELKRRNALEPLKTERDEIVANSDRNTAVQARKVELEASISRVREEFGVQRKVVKNELDGLERRADGLRSEIQKIKDEEEQLQQTLQKRMRDLGHHFYSGRIHEELYTTRYGQLDLLQQELAALRHQPDKSVPATAERKTSRLWKGFAYFVGLAALIGVVLFWFRTPYQSLPLPIAQLARDADAKAINTVVYQTEAGATPLDLPSWLAGTRVAGSELLGDLGSSSLKRWFLARTGSELHSLAVQFTQARPLLQKLQDSGWVPVPNDRKLEAVGRDRWVWIHFGQNAYALVSQDSFGRLDWSQQAKTGWTKRASFPFNPIASDHPVLEGYDGLDIRVAGSSEIRYKSSAVVSDFEDRKALIELSAQQLGATFDNQDILLNVQGPEIPSSMSSPELCQKSAIALLSGLKVEGRLHRVAANALDSEHVEEDRVLAVPKSERQVILAINPRRDELQLVATALVGEHLTDLVTLSDGSLVLSDRGAGALIRLNLTSDYFSVLGLHQFESPQRPLRLTVSADGQHLLVLLENADGGPGWLVLVEPEELKVLSSVRLPDGVGQGRSLLSTGGFAYVGVENKNQGPMTHAVVAYRVEYEKLALSHLMDLPTQSNTHVRASSLQVAQTRGNLIVFNTANGSLGRFSLVGQETRPTDYTPVTLLNRVSPRNPLVHDDPGALTVGRDQRYILMSDITDFATRTYGTRLFLVDLDADRPVVMGEADLEGMIYGVCRQPLSNRFYVTMSNDRRISRVNIVDGTVVVSDSHEFMRFSPQRLAFSQFGDLMFVTGLLRDDG